jgi:hypothetical protein
VYSTLESRQIPDLKVVIGLRRALGGCDNAGCF